MSINCVFDGLRDRRLAVIQDEMSEIVESNGNLKFTVHLKPLRCKMHGYIGKKWRKDDDYVRFHIRPNKLKRADGITNESNAFTRNIFNYLLIHCLCTNRLSQC